MSMPSNGTRLSGIDGLRGLACFAIVCFHVMLVLRTSSDVHLPIDVIAGLLTQGLTLFFVLSGFLLYRPYVSAVLRGRPLPQPREFLRNRVLRIWPAYLVVLVLVGLVLGLARIDAHSSGSLDTQAAALGRFDDPLMFIANALLIQGWVPDYMYTGLVVSWSLATEVGFYLLLPPMGFLAWRVARRAPKLLAVLLPALLLGLIGLTVRFTTLYFAFQQPESERAPFIAGATWTAAPYRSVFGQGDLLAAGMLAAVVVTAVPAVSVRRARLWIWVAACLGGMAAVLTGGGELGTPFFALFFAGGVALIQLPAPSSAIRGFTRFLESDVVRMSGECSYSVYLWHCTPIWLLRLHTDFTFATTAELIACLLAVVPCAYLLGWITYRRVELPFMQRKKHEKTAPIIQPAAV